MFITPCAYPKEINAAHLNRNTKVYDIMSSIMSGHLTIELRAKNTNRSRSDIVQIIIEKSVSLEILFYCHHFS